MVGCQEQCMSGCSGLSNISARCAPCPKVLASRHFFVIRACRTNVPPVMSALPCRSLHFTLRCQGRIFATKRKGIYGENLHLDPFGRGRDEQGKALVVSSSH